MSVKFDDKLLLRLSQPEKDRLYRYAEEQGKKPAQLVRDAIKEKLDNFEKAKKTLWN